MTTSLSDEELAGRALRKDEGAFAELYDRYRRPVYSIAYRIIQDPQDAQDATQEVFVKLFRSLARWDPAKAKFSTWLYRLAANHSIDHWRLSRRRRESQMPDDGPERDAWSRSLGDAIRSPYKEVESRDHVERIRGCTDALPELQKKVFVLRYFHDLKLEEIAGMEGCSLGTVKTSLFRATQAIRRAVRRSGGMR
jgi:RNA polymerase sigma-70 factor (ECF subfamily)